MSELKRSFERHAQFRWQLLATVSALALITTASTSGEATAADNSHPTVWIELGGQLERINSGSEQFVPLFEGAHPAAGFTPSTEIDRAPRYANGLEGKVALRPSGSDWTFSASLRYGRSNREHSRHEQTSPNSAIAITSVPYFSIYRTNKIVPGAARFADAHVQHNASSAVIDFQAGRDVGLGLPLASSVFNLGVRFAQFTTSSNRTVGANPDFEFLYYSSTIHRYFFTLYFVGAHQRWHLYHADMNDRRSFRGIGPSLSWNGSIPLAGSAGRSQILLDWGANAAMLFGRQKAQVHHQTTGQYRSPYNFGAPSTVYHHVYDRSQSKSVIVPNLGGFAGVSFKYDNAKLSLGYRADFFFGAMDGGIDARKSYDRSFHGPFATISIGLGG